VLALAGVLKKRLVDAFDRSLDFLGKYGIGAAARRKFRRIYLTNLVAAHKYLKLVGFNIAGLPRLLFEEVYISLKVSSHGRRFDTLADASESRISVSFTDAVQRFDRLVILGPPGSGKTTTLSYLALVFASDIHKNPTLLRSVGVRFPIYIPLRRLSPGSKLILEDLVDPNSQILPEEVLRELPERYFHDRLEKGECILLFDGLDEVTDEGTHQQVAQRINTFVERYPKNRFVVTCRIAGWRNLLPAFTVVEADELSREEIHRFIRGWHKAVIGLQERNRIEQEFSDPTIRGLKWQMCSHK
jgi:predicted NACHT family NTPase